MFIRRFVGLSGSGAVSSLGNIEGGERQKIRLTKKTNVRKRFGVDPWEQPIPKRWKADTFRRSFVFHGQEGGIFCSGSRLSHVNEPHGNWLIIRLHSPTPPGEVHVGSSSVFNAWYLEFRVWIDTFATTTTLPGRVALLSRAGELSSQSGPDPLWGAWLVKLGASQGSAGAARRVRWWVALPTEQLPRGLVRRASPPSGE